MGGVGLFGAGAPSAGSAGGSPSFGAGASPDPGAASSWGAGCLGSFGVGAASPSGVSASPGAAVSGVAAPPSGAVAAPPSGEAPPSASATLQHAPSLPKNEERSFILPTIRVHTSKLEKLMSLVQELVISKIRFEQVAATKSLVELSEPLSQLHHVTDELQDEIMKVRLMPVKQIFERFPRMVRDLAKSLGKQVDLEMEGAEVEIDRTVIEEMSEPLVHLLRNAVAWATGGAQPMTVQGAGLIDVSYWRQDRSLAAHLVNLNNPASMKGFMHEIVPLGPLTVNLALPQGARAGRVRLLEAERDAKTRRSGNRLIVEVPRVGIHEVIAVDLV